MTGLLARNIFWLTTGEVLSRLVAFVVAISVARTIGADAYGTLGIALALVGYLVVVVDGGLEPAAVREAARDHSAVPALFRLLAARRLALAGAMALLLLLLVAVLPDRMVGSKVLAIVFGGRLLTYALKVDWALRARDEMRTVATGLILQHAVYAAGVFLLLSQPRFPLILLAVVYVTAECALLTFYVYRLRRAYPALFTPAVRWSGGDLLRESMPVGVGKLLRIAYYEGDLISIGFLSTAEQAGYFFAAQRVSLSVAALILLHQQSAFPALSRLMQLDVVEGARFQQRVSGYALLWTVPAAAGAVMLSAPFMAALFGEEYRTSGPTLALLLLTIPVMLVQIGLHNQMLATGRTRAYLWTVAAGTAAHVLFGVLWTRTWGAAGAAAASLIGELIICLSAAWYVAMIHRTAPLERRSCYVLAAGAAMTGVMLVASPGGPILAAAAGLVVYAGFVLAAGAFTPGEARAVAALIRHGQPPPVSTTDR